MILHGEMVIELTDENTGTVETVRETNMITNAVNHLLGLNPMGVFYKASGQYDDTFGACFRFLREQHSV